MKHFFLILFFAVAAPAAGQQDWSIAAGGFLQNDFTNRGASFMLLRSINCDCGKWVKRFNPMLAGDFGPAGTYLKGGTSITVYQARGFSNQLSIDILPFYLNYHAHINKYNSPIGVLARFDDYPLNFTVFSSWYKDRTSVQIILTYKLSKKRNKKA